MDETMDHIELSGAESDSTNEAKAVEPAGNEIVGNECEQVSAVSRTEAEWDEAKRRVREAINEYRARYNSEQTEKTKSDTDEPDKTADARSYTEVNPNRDRREQDALNAGIRAIQKYDPGIKTVQDLAAMPEYADFYNYVQKGISFEDAYILTHRNIFTDRNAAAVHQAAYNTQSKAHLVGSSSRGRGGAEVPRDVLEQYKFFNPDATMDEIRAHWARSRK